MNYQQHSGRPRLNSNSTNRVPSLLPGPAVKAVRPDKATLIFENERREFE
jgi:hypothetical protein